MSSSQRSAEDRLRAEMFTIDDDIMREAATMPRTSPGSRQTTQQDPDPQSELPAEEEE